MGSNPIGAWNLLLSYPCVALDGKLQVAFFLPLCMIKLQRIYYYHETFPCLLVEHFQLGLLTWKDDVTKWFIGTRVKLPISWSNLTFLGRTGIKNVTVNWTYYPT